MYQQQHRSYNQFSRELEEDPSKYDPADSSMGSEVSGAQCSAQVRAATAQVQRRKWPLGRSSFGIDYIGYTSTLYADLSVL
jgi:hypothetical protein